MKSKLSPNSTTLTTTSEFPIKSPSRISVKSSLSKAKQITISSEISKAINRPRRFVISPLGGHDYETTKFLLWDNIAKKPEGTCPAIDTISAPKEKPATSQDLELAKQKEYRLQKYVERIERERHKDYNDKSGIYHDNLTTKFSNLISPNSANEPSTNSINELSTPQGPFYIDKVYEFAHKTSPTKPINLKPVNVSFNAKTHNNLTKLLNTIHNCIAKKSNQSLERTLSSLKVLGKNTSIEPELNDFVQLHLSPSNKHLKTVFLFHNKSN